MSYPIEPVFILFPICCLILSWIGIGNRLITKICISCAFILLYSLSLNGTDIFNYGWIYDQIKNSGSLQGVHGEMGFRYLMKIFIDLGADYFTFRSILLSLCSLFLFVSLAKMSDNFALSVFFISSMFIVYTTSAYRQYTVIVGSIWALYIYGNGKRIRSILLVAVLMLFHTTAIIPLICLIYYHYGQKRGYIEKHTLFFRKNYLKIILICLALRIVLAIVLNIGVFQGIMNKLLAGHASWNSTLFSLGLVSRVVITILISYLYYLNENNNTSSQLLYWYYFLSMLLYIIVPHEFVMGRLMNNANIVLAILIPVLRFNYDKIQDIPGIIKIRKTTIAILIVEMVAIIVLVNQLSQQSGYTPYVNIIQREESQQYYVDNFNLYFPNN